MPTALVDYVSRWLHAAGPKILPLFPAKGTPGGKGGGGNDNSSRSCCKPCLFGAWVVAAAAAVTRTS